MKLRAGGVQAFAAHESHRVERAAIIIMTEGVDGHDAWMFQPTCDFGFQQKTLATFGDIGMLWLDLFQGDFAV